jgi:two-component system, NarL family, sensor kinase
MDQLVEPARWPRAPRGFAPGVVGAAAVLLVAIVVGNLTGAAASRLDQFDFMPVASLTFTLVGALVVPREPRSPIGWLLLGIGGSSAVAVLGASYSTVSAMAWLYAWTPAVAYGLLPVVLLLFPDGRLLSRAWRPVVWFAAVAALAMTVPLAAAAWAEPRLLVDASEGSAPIATRIGFAAVVLGLLAAVGSLLVRWRRAGGDTRQQLKWLGFGAAFVPVGLGAQVLHVPGAWAIPAITVPGAIAVAILKYRLYDIDLFLNRSLVYATLTVLVIACYAAVVAALGAVFAGGEAWQRVVAVGVVAVAFAPLRDRVQRAANRLLYGDRDDPYAVLSRLSRRLESTVDPTTVLPQVAATVAEALQLPYVAIELNDGEGGHVVAGHGRRIGEPEAFDMTYQGRVVGRLLVSPRTAGEPFTGAERTLVEELARQAGLAARTVGLTADLQRSRERLVRSQEDERRRMRRDLHDGLGPALAGMTMQVGVARALLPTAPDRVEDLLGELEKQLQACVRDIRQLVDDLRPTALDRLGLVGAVRQRAAAFTSAGGGAAPVIEVHAPADLPELPAAVEVAAYRIATEAMTNVVRHAAARHATVRFDLDDGLVVEITDDGAGLPAVPRAGVGLASMRERTDELGGRLAVEQVPSGGTRVRAVLPLAVEQ